MFGPTQMTCEIRQQCIALSHEHHIQFSTLFTGKFSGAFQPELHISQATKINPAIKQEIQHYL